MATVLFREKPGCIDNTRQKTLLQHASHTVEARNRGQGRSYKGYEMRSALLREISGPDPTAEEPGSDGESIHPFERCPRERGGCGVPE